MMHDHVTGHDTLLWHDMAHKRYIIKIESNLKTPGLTPEERKEGWNDWKRFLVMLVRNCYCKRPIHYVEQSVVKRG